MPGTLVRSALQGFLQARVGDPVSGGFVAYALDDQLIGSVWGGLCQSSSLSDGASSPVARLIALDVDDVTCSNLDGFDGASFSMAALGELVDVSPQNIEFSYQASSGSCISLPDYTDKIAVGGTQPDRV